MGWECPEVASLISLWAGKPKHPEAAGSSAQWDGPLHGCHDDPNYRSTAMYS